MKKTVADKNGGHDIELSEEEKQKIRDEHAANSKKDLISLKVNTRKNMYGTYDQQLELMYQDKINRTDNWINHRKAVNDAIPLDNTPLSKEKIDSLSTSLNISNFGIDLNLGLQ